MNLLILRWLAVIVKPYSSAAPTAPDLVSDASLTRLVRASLLLLFTYVFLANAWMGDDAYITYRVVWNFVHGYGLTFNPDERVRLIPIRCGCW